MTRMTLEKVQKGVKMVCDIAARGDYEMAHGMEDDMHIEVLTEIAEGKISRDEMVALASAACETGKIDFPRYTA